MSKSMLIINTPKKCSDCILPTICKDGETVYCKGFPEVIKNPSEKPDWCPLVEVEETIKQIADVILKEKMKFKEKRMSSL